MLVLALETSCDETSASVVNDKNVILSNIVSSSQELFESTGGVVPEVAARKQVEYVLPVIDTALSKARVSLKDINYLAVTVGPGLIGSLFVGVSATKTLSLIINKPIIPVNHLLGHIFSVFVKEYQGTFLQKTLPEFPLLSLVVSGGHTDLVLLKNPKEIIYLGGTRDDAVGEAFDKVARMLGLSKYLGGPKISQKAKEFELQNKKTKINFPRPLMDSDNYDFSFSGLKTAVLRYLESTSNFNISEVAYAFEEAVVEVLLYKLKKAYDTFKPKSVSIVGGVSANSKLREKALDLFEHNLFLPPLYLCGDNAGMIGIASSYYFNTSTTNLSKINPNPSLSLQKPFDK